MTRSAVAVLLSLLSAAAGAQAPAAPAAAGRTLPVVVPNDNRHPAGALRDGVVELRLVARMARWFPAGERDSAIVVPTLGVEGGAPQIPAPLVRVARGTAVRLVVRNALADSLAICVRASAACGSADTLRLAAGEVKTLVVANADTGTFAWYGGARAVLPGGEVALLRAQMIGAWIVDGAAPRADRVMVLNGWSRPRAGPNGDADERFLIAINGRIWPNTERLAYETGDTVRWRLVNGSFVAHPMHLHGFYFAVASRGDGHRDVAFPATRRPLEVTEEMEPLATASLEWVPTRAGNWLFHCHKSLHVSAQRLVDLRDGAPRRFTMPPDSHMPPEVAGVGLAVNPSVMHALHEMSGMIVGIEVQPRRGAPVPDVAAAPPANERHLRVLMQSRAGAFGRDPEYGFALQRGDAEPPPDSLPLPSAPIVLTRGEPVAITVVNRLPETSGVHWHGIELQSYFDGVGGWSGAGQRVAPMIAPGDSFVARFTPPRAGTFTYHAHADEQRQLSSGLAAALIVLEPGKTWDPAHDHVLLVTQGGPADSAAIVLNGRAAPQAMELAANVPHRFRLISIAAQDDIGVALMRDGAVTTWRALAKDGADLPPDQAVSEPARRKFGPGETFDFEVASPPGEMHLAIVSFTNVLLTLRFK